MHVHSLLVGGAGKTPVHVRHQYIASGTTEPAQVQSFAFLLFVSCVLHFRFRWDIQRIREQRLLQRLQLRMYKKKGIQESEPEILSFFPEPDDGRFKCRASNDHGYCQMIVFLEIKSSQINTG